MKLHGVFIGLETEPDSGWLWIQHGHYGGSLFECLSPTKARSELTCTCCFGDPSRYGTMFQWDYLVGVKTTCVLGVILWNKTDHSCSSIKLRFWGLATRVCVCPCHCFRLDRPTIRFSFFTPVRTHPCKSIGTTQSVSQRSIVYSVRRVRVKWSLEFG